jgi:osmoprotectant transport system permease protein
VPAAELLPYVWIHLELTAAALAIAAALALPLGIVTAYAGRARGPILAVAAVGRTIPSLAVLTFVLPFLGVGFTPAIVALTLLALAPMVINTDLGLRGVAPASIDAARGMGMTGVQVFARVAWPLALPTIFTGVRTAAIEVVASATLATFIGAGGLGDVITEGLQGGRGDLILEGAIAAAILALAIEAALALTERTLIR